MANETKLADHLLTSGLTTEAEQKHTPGPWVARDDRTIAANGVPLLRCYAGRNEKANARVIAAAPELLEVLQEAVAQYGKPGGPWNVPSDPGGWLDRARQAIARATGAQ
ncbi:MAG: hypothetical protein B7Z36_02360 [Novosphingobium sp. 12-63-9]|nr:MAG: hypothetical protein B7Z36_02360 [Novosphingobium sp. 12-63-9]